MKVAISYHPEDSPKVDQLKAMLKYAPEEYIVFPDGLEPNAEKLNLEKERLQKLDEVDALLFLQGEHERRTPFVNNMLDFALNRQIPIIPIKVNDEVAGLPPQIQG